MLRIVLIIGILLVLRILLFLAKRPGVYKHTFWGHHPICSQRVFVNNNTYLSERIADGIYQEFLSYDIAYQSIVRTDFLEKLHDSLSAPVTFDEAQKRIHKFFSIQFREKFNVVETEEGYEIDLKDKRFLVTSEFLAEHYCRAIVLEIITKELFQGYIQGVLDQNNINACIDDWPVRAWMHPNSDEYTKDMDALPYFMLGAFNGEGMFPARQPQGRPEPNDDHGVAEAEFLLRVKAYELPDEVATAKGIMLHRDAAMGDVKFEAFDALVDALMEGWRENNEVADHKLCRLMKKFMSHGSEQQGWLNYETANKHFPELVEGLIQETRQAKQMSTEYGSVLVQCADQYPASQQRNGRVYFD